MTIILLENKANPNALDEAGNTPLHWACARGILNIVNRLTDLKADVNIANKQGAVVSSNMLLHSLSLSWKSMNHDFYKYVSSFIFFPPLYYHNIYIFKALHKACGFGQNACVKKLIDCGAEVDLVDNKGNTGLHLASQLGFDLVVKFLLSKGAKTDVKNSDGKTAAEVALDPTIAALFN